MGVRWLYSPNPFLRLCVCLGVAGSSIRSEGELEENVMGEWVADSTGEEEGGVDNCFEECKEGIFDGR